MGAEHDDERKDDTTLDDQPGRPSEDGLDSFPDPSFDEELPEPQEPGSPVMAGEPNLPAEPPLLPPAPTPLTPPSPPADGGFTPYTPPRHEPPPKPDIKFFTTAQLRQGVNDGLITEDQMVDQLQLQNRELAAQQAVDTFRREQHQQTITQQLNQYRHLIPGWDQPGSQANLRANPEYERLLRLGLPESDTTRLLALEHTFGPVQRIQEARAAKVRTATLRDTSQEVGRSGPSPQSTASKDPLKILSKDDLREYKRLIEKDVYTDWDEVRAELRYSAQQTSNPQLRAKHVGLMK